MDLPPPNPVQPFWYVSALEGGFIELRDVMFIEPCNESNIRIVPSLAFLLTHTSGEKVMFDLGIRKDFETGHTPATVKWIHDVYPTTVPQDVVQSLAKGNLTPSDITTVILSHLHWDHVGNPALFPRANFILGSGGEELLRTGYPRDPHAGVAQDLVPPHRTRLMKTDGWAPLGPFPRAFDFLGDGSLYLVDAPGHLAGHINALARTSSDGGWMYLAGDSAHHYALISGEAEVAFGHPGHGIHLCAHVDKAAADEHIWRIRELNNWPRVKVLLAHDDAWYRENRGGRAFWPGYIPSL
ncbi:hypothetical protein ONZ45_g16109 [Pleurotus djamor]|nr:hypothetical protein ONZ45_g16109 [Pleurotus djamor]